MIQKNTNNKKQSPKNTNSKKQDPKERRQKKNKKGKMENSGKIYDLEERTAVYAERVRNFCLKLPKNMANTEYIPQLI